MNWEAVHVFVDIVTLLLSGAAFLFSSASRRGDDIAKLKERISSLEADGKHQLSADDLGRLTAEIHELRGELKTTVRTVERMNQFLMERGAAA